MESEDPLGPPYRSMIDLNRIHPNNRDHPIIKMILDAEEEIFETNYETDEYLKQAEADGMEHARLFRKLLRL